MTEPGTVSRWWSEFEAEEGHGWRWILGNFELVIFRASGEWLLASEPAQEDQVDCEKCVVAPVSQVPEDASEIVRFATSGSQKQVRLVPTVADRSVVARPRLPLHLVSDEETKIYVSSPVWVEVVVGKSMQSLCELSVRRLSDTWFGPNTRVGEVAYALKTHARVDLTELPRRCYRLITPISITNDGQEPLLLDRISIPVPHLSVYAAVDGSLWSESVSLVRSEGVELASMRIGKGPPREIKGAKRLSGPREVSEPNILVRAFTTLFSRSQED